MNLINNIMKEEYYIPLIEDLKVGYECEIRMINYQNIDVSGNSDTWKPWIIGKEYLDKETLTEIKFQIPSSLRTPYLTKEQIEKDGWNFIEDWGNSTNEFEKHYSDNDYRLKTTYTYSTKELNIFLDGVSNDLTIDFYNGKCPSINEFRMLLKLLNI